MNYFDHKNIQIDALQKKAFNLRWAVQPEDVIPLTAADPDFPVAPEIREAMKSYIDEGYFSYGPGPGLPEFRATVAEVLYNRKKIIGTPEQVLATNSAAFGMFLLAKYLLEPGDEAIIFDPVDFLFKKSVEEAGGEVVLLEMDLKTRNFDFEVLKSLVSTKTKFISICNPHNPLGRVWTKEELMAIGELAVANDLWVLSDEIWSDIVFTPSVFHSMASLSPEIASRTFTVYGFSKSFGLAGLRIGFVHSPSIEESNKLIQFSKVDTTAYGVSTLSQIGAIAAWTKAWYWVSHFLDHLKEVRDYAVERLNEIEGIECHSPQGTYLLFPNIQSLGIDEDELATFLLNEGRVAVVPGSPKWFGPGAKGHIRICFSTSKEIVAEGINRIEESLKRLKTPE